MDPSNAFVPAFNHMVWILFRPFVLRNWLALGFVSLFAGGSGGNFRLPGPSGSDSPAPGDVSEAQVIAWIMQHLALIVLAVLALFLLGLLFAWIGAVMRFVYVNQITRSPSGIKEPFARFKHLGTSYFLWLLAFGAVFTVALGVLVALPLLAAFLWSNGGIGAKVVAVAWAIAVGLLIIIGSVVADVFARDFVVPTMLVRKIGVLDAWRVVIPIVRANMGPSALFLLFLIVIAIGVGLFSLVAVFATLLVLAIPGGLAAWGGYALWRGAGETWSPALIAYIGTVGTVIGAVFVYVMMVALQPAMVFRRTYSLIVLGQADPSLATVPAPPDMG